jgi:hypothetical protein
MDPSFPATGRRRRLPWVDRLPPECFSVLACVMTHQQGARSDDGIEILTGHRLPSMLCAAACMHVPAGRGQLVMAATSIGYGYYGTVAVRRRR